MTSADIFLLVRERVARGVEWLNSQDPDWRLKVDVETFDIYDPRMCVLGQVFDGKSTRSGYDYAFEALGMLDYCGHGFDADYEIRYEYEAVRREWARVLADSPNVVL